MAHEDLHQHVSFDDPDEARTWVFDLTFLASTWTCLYGRGCPGVLTEPSAELEQGCCSYGAHFVDEDDEADTLAAAARLDESQWQHAAVAARKGGPTKRSGRRGPRGSQPSAPTAMTRLHDGACIFLNRPGFPAGAGCALHQGALAAGERPLDWKPDVCWQLPLRLEEHTDDHGHVTSTLREWKRRDWGPGGDEFAWWCTDAPDAFTDRRRVVDTMRDEIVALVGEGPYQLLLDHLDQGGASPATTTTLLPHPAVRAATTDQGAPR